MKTKYDFKKLALMGITGGVTLCSSASASQTNSIDNTVNMLAANCGGKHGCGGKLQAYQPHGCGSAQPQVYYNNAPNQGQPSSCSSAGRPNGQGSCGASKAPANNNGGNYTAYQPHGCGASQPQVHYNNAPNQGQQPAPSHCGAANKANGQGSCSAHKAPANGQGEPQAYNANRGINSKNSMGGNAANHGVNAEEAHFESQLSTEGKMIYKGLDPAGKELVKKIMVQSGTKDVNEAVKQAAQQMAEQRAKMGAPKY